jgi:MFS transporter, DHA3 family, macrolide efflux protein
MTGMSWRRLAWARPDLGRDLNFLLGGQLVANAGSRVFDIVLIWYALDLAESYASVGLLLFLRYIPYALFGLVCGWLSDFLDRRKLIVAADLFRAALLVAGAIALATGYSPLVVLAVCAFLLTAARTLFQPAVQGLLPQLADGPRLVRANAVLHGTTEMIGVAAPVLGGLMLVVLPAPVMLAMISICLVVGAIMTAAIRVGPLPERRPIRLTDFLTEYQDLWRVLAGARRDVLVAIIIDVVAILGVAGILSLLIPILVKDHIGAGPAALGTLWSVMALGTVVGAAASVRLSIGQREHGMLISWLAYGLMIGALVLPTQFALVLGIGFVLGAVGAMADVLFAIIIQERMRGDQVSKTFAGFSTLANCGEAVSAPVLGLVTATFGLSAGFALGALLPVVAAVAGLVYLARRRPSEPTESPS